MNVAADRFVDIGDARLHYLEWGDGGAPPLLLLHGFSSSAHGWDDVAPAFADAYRVIAVDHRGHGESDWHPDAKYSTSLYVRDLNDFVSALALPAFDLVGHSMGGGIALVYAAWHPEQVKRLVLEDSGARRPARDGDAARFFETYAARPLYFPSREEAEAWVKPTVAAAFTRRSLTYGLVELPDGRVTWRADVRGLSSARREGADPVLSAGLWQEIEQLQCPTLVIRGGDSTTLLAETVAEMRARNPRIESVEVPAASHWVHYDDPDAFIRLATAFLSGQPVR